MADAKSATGSQSSPRSSLRGWSGSLGPGTKSREDIDATISSTSSYTSTRALHPPMSVPHVAGSSGSSLDMRAVPSSSPCLTATSGPSRKLAEVGSPDKPMEHQLKQERIWWSEQTLFEVQKMELALKQELHKTTAALREQFKRQLEIERNENQQRSSAMDRSISRLREDFDAVREQQDVSAPVRQVADNLSHMEASIRLELDAMRCSIEDYQRQHSEELSVQVAAHQASLEAERARLQSMTAGLREELRGFDGRLRNSEVQSRQHASAVSDATARPAGAPIQAVEASIEAALAEERNMRLKELEGLREETRCLGQELAEERVARAQAMASAAAKSAGDSASAAGLDVRIQELERSLENDGISRKAEVAALHSELARAREVQSAELNGVRDEWKTEITKTAQDIATEMLGRRQELTNLRGAVEELKMHSGAGAGGDAMQELTHLLEIECKARKNDVEDLKHQLSLTEALFSERAAGDGVQSSLSEIDMRVGGLVNALETERDHRRSDADRHQAAITDMMDALQAERQLRTAEAEKLRAVLAELALNMQSALAQEASQEGQRGLANTLASLQAALTKDSSQEGSLPEADRGPPKDNHHMAALARETADLAAKVRALGGELREELNSRIDVVVASMKGDLAAKAAELRGDLAASRAELKGELLKHTEEGVPASQGNSSGGGMGLQSSAALAGQLSEVVRFMQVIASGTEHLGERLCAEANDRRQGEARVEARISSVERRLADVGAGQEDLEMEQLEQRQLQEEEMLLQQQMHMPGPDETCAVSQNQKLSKALMQQSLMNEGLKDSLEQLVSRVNRMLKPEDIESNASRRDGMGAPYSSHSRGASPTRSASVGQGQIGFPRGQQAPVPSRGSSACPTPTAVMSGKPNMDMGGGRFSMNLASSSGAPEVRSPTGGGVRNMPPGNLGPPAASKAKEAFPQAQPKSGSYSAAPFAQGPAGSTRSPVHQGAQRPSPASAQQPQQLQQPQRPSLQLGARPQPGQPVAHPKVIAGAPPAKAGQPQPGYPSRTGPGVARTYM